MKGWFDAFRNDGGPTLYSFNNRTAVTGDATVITFLTVFCSLYVAFLIIFPGIRKERFTTFFVVTLSLFVGATIMISMFGSSWHVATAAISSTYTAFSRRTVPAEVGVFVGLSHINITLRAASSNWTSDVEFNERFLWINSEQMHESFREALVRGLPYPILTVAEYFTTGQEGLAWGVQYRSAGYVATIILWASFAVWFLMNIMIIVVPRYGAVLMTACGFLLLSTVCTYFGLLPEPPLMIHIEGRSIYFCLGWCFWLVLIAGVICLLSGVIITAIEIIYPHSFSTILEVDYDTPYDRHTIIEDSHGRRYQKKRSSCGKLEEGPVGGLRTKILRRLSSIAKERGATDGAQSSGRIRTVRDDYELSNWQYPLRMSKGNGLDPVSTPKSTPRESLNSTTLSRHDNKSPGKEFSRYKMAPEIHQVSMW